MRLAGLGGLLWKGWEGQVGGSRDWWLGARSHELAGRDWAGEAGKDEPLGGD